MRICTLQHDIAWMDTAANLARLDAMIGSQPSADLYVLAEMFATGFATEPCGDGRLEASGERALAWMRATAQRRGAALAGSIAMRGEDGRWRNRFCLVGQDGSVSTYDKRHLFGYGGEDLCYAPGCRRVVAECQGVRMLLQVCYDLRFPVWSRCRGDYDAIVYVANWPESRMAAWQTLLRARAIENQCYVVGVNRVGDDPRCHYGGATAIVGPRGETLAECNSEGRTEAAMASIDLLALQRFRQRFDVLRDADTFTVNV